MGPAGPQGPAGPAGTVPGVQRVVFGTVPASGIVPADGGFSVTPEAATCAYGSVDNQVPCTFYQIQFSTPFNGVPACTATVMGSDSFFRQPAGIVITGVTASNLGVVTGTENMEGSGSFPFSFICVQ